MKLYEKLKELIGHEVFIFTQIRNEDNDVPGGVIKEVGEDYFILRTRGLEDGGHVDIGTDWYVRIETVIHFIHVDDCKKCVEATVIEEVNTKRTYR
jgi:ferredoxin-fold anticodon binding domain-containing protein